MSIWKKGNVEISKTAYGDYRFWLGGEPHVRCLDKQDLIDLHFILNEMLNQQGEQCGCGMVVHPHYCPCHKEKPHKL